MHWLVLPVRSGSGDEWPMAMAGRRSDNVLISILVKSETRNGWNVPETRSRDVASRVSRLEYVNRNMEYGIQQSQKVEPTITSHHNTTPFDLFPSYIPYSNSTNIHTHIQYDGNHITNKQRQV